MKIRGYPKYAESQSEWFGELPAHWKAAPTKRSYRIQLGKMLQPSAILPQDQELCYLKAQHVSWEAVRVQNLPTMWASPTDEKKYGVRTGDLLVCEGGDVGRAAILSEISPGTIIQNALHRVRPKYKNQLSVLDVRA